MALMQIITDGQRCNKVCKYIENAGSYHPWSHFLFMFDGSILTCLCYNVNTYCKERCLIRCEFVARVVIPGVTGSIWGAMFIAVRWSVFVIPPVPLVWMRYGTALWR